MGNYIKKANGQMAGSIGSGRDEVPTSPMTGKNEAANIDFLLNPQPPAEGTVTITITLAELARIVRDSDAA